MRNRALWFMIILAMLSACTANSSQTNPAITGATAPAEEAPALQPTHPTKPFEPAVTGQPGQAYPAPTAEPLQSGYPVAPEMAQPPTAYPGSGGPSGSAASITPTSGQVRWVEAVARDLSVNFDVPMDEIKLVSFETITWPNSGLGCPGPGMNYLDVLVEGNKITLNVGGKTFTYHTDTVKNFILCQDGARLSEGTLP